MSSNNMNSDMEEYEKDAYIHISKIERIGGQKETQEAYSIESLEMDQELKQKSQNLKTPQHSQSMQREWSSKAAIEKGTNKVQNQGRNDLPQNMQQQFKNDLSF